MSKFSDPEWWPQRPPQPLPTKPTPKLLVVVGAILPVLAIAAIAVLVVNYERHHHHKPAAARSLEAFGACMKAEGADTPSQLANARLLQQSAVACRGHLPDGVPLPDFTAPPATSGPPPNERDAFDQCVQSLTANLRGGGRPGGGSRSQFQNAVALCRTLAQRSTTVSPPT